MTRRSLFALAATPLLKALPKQEPLEAYMAASIDSPFVWSHGIPGLDDVGPPDLRVWVDGKDFPEAQAFDTRTGQVHFVIFDRVPDALTRRGKVQILLPRPDDPVQEGIYTGPFEVMWIDKHGSRCWFSGTETGVLPDSRCLFNLHLRPGYDQPSLLAAVWSIPGVKAVTLYNRGSGRFSGEVRHTPGSRVFDAILDLQSKYDRRDLRR